MRPQGTVKEWDDMDKRDQVYSRPGTGGMFHGIQGQSDVPGHPMAKSDHPQMFCMIFNEFLSESCKNHNIISCKILE